MASLSRRSGVLSNIPWNRWETVRSSAVPTESLAVDIIFVHDLLKKDAESIEQFMIDACSSASSATKFTYRISFYRFTSNVIQKSGRFEDESEALLDHVKSLIQPRILPTASGEQPSRSIVFVTYELGTWLVRNMLYNETLASDNDAKDLGMILPRIAGIIFLGADELPDFPYGTYVQKRMGESRTSIDPARGDWQRRVTSFSGRLRALDEDFRNSLHHDILQRLSKRAWILPAPESTTGSECPTISRPLSPQMLPAVARSKSKTLMFKVTSRVRRGSRHAHSAHPSGTTDALPFCIHLIKYALRDDSHLSEAQVNGWSPEREVYNRYLYLRKPVTIGKTADVAEKDSELLNSPSLTNPVPSLTHLESSNGTLLETSPQVPALIRIDSTDSRYDGDGGLTPTYSPPGSPRPTTRPIELDISKANYDGRERSLSPSLEMSRRDHTKRDSFSSKLDSNETLESILKDIDEKIAKHFAEPRGRKNESRFWRDCIKPLAVMEPVPAVCYRLKIRLALLSVQQGHQRKGKIELENIKKHVSEDRAVFCEASYHLAMVLTRLGEHRKALDDLRALQCEDKFKDAEKRLDSSTVTSDEVLENTLMDVVVNTYRRLATLHGYYGQFDRAYNFLEHAERLCRKLPQVRLGCSYEERDYIKKPIVRIPIDTRVLSAKIDLAKAKLHVLSGREDDALWNSESIVNQLEIELGEKHIVTLEASCLHAQALARRADREAEIVCKKVFDATQRYLDEGHPVIMEALGTLVDIFLAQSRPYEALDTVFALRHRAKIKLGDTHPHFLRYWCQVGEINLSVGNYARAAWELAGLYDASQGIWPENRASELRDYPDSLRYLTRLAVANCSLWRVTEADRQIRQAIERQAKIFLPACAGMEEVQVSKVMEALQCDSDEIPHPDLLASLAAHATIIEKGDSQDHSRIPVLHVVYTKRQKLYGPSHYLTLQSYLDYSFARLDMADPAQAQEEIGPDFSKLSRQCEQLLGEKNIMTLRAKFGDLLTNGLDYGRLTFKLEATKIMVGQEVLLGDCHPVVLDSLARLFGVQLTLGDDDAHATASKILSVVRQTEIRKERLMESLQLEGNIAALYALQAGDYEHGLPILNDILSFHQAIKNTRNAEGFELDLDIFGRHVCSVSEMAAKTAREGLQGANDPHSNATRLAIETFLERAQELKAGGDEDKRAEGLTVLGRLLEQASQMKGTDSVGWLSDKIKARYEKLRQSWQAQDEAAQSVEVTEPVTHEQKQWPEERSERSPGGDEPDSQPLSVEDDLPT